MNFKEPLHEIKLLIQHMLEVMAISQVTEFPNVQFPLLKILINKFVYCPLLYFKEDVLLTTALVMHLQKDANCIDGLGLVLMFVLFHIYKAKVCNFNADAIKEFPPKFGWKKALSEGTDNCVNSKLQVVEVKAKLPHATSCDEDDLCESVSQLKFMEY